MKIRCTYKIISAKFCIWSFPQPNHSVIFITVQGCSILRIWVWCASFIEVCSINHNFVGQCPVLNVIVEEIIICWAVYIDVICNKIMLDNFHRWGLWYVTQLRVTVLNMWLELSPRLCETYSNSAFGHSSPCVTIRITNRCDFLYYVFISFFSSFPYMFWAFMGPSSGVFLAVVFMLPFGSCSALLVVCVRQLTHADDQQSTAWTKW